jgi:hypothetical protein
MSTNDDWTPEVVDDPEPPEPDAAVLARVVGRGRQRLVRRRSLIGLLATSLAVVLVGGGVAVAQHRDEGSRVAVGSDTTGNVGAVTQREADAGGLHFTLTLTTPTVEALDPVRVTLRVDNHSDAAVDYGACEVGSLGVYMPHRPLSGPLRGDDATCPAIGVVVDAGHSYTWDASTVAPADPGEYWVIAKPNDTFPASLREPLSLKVVARTHITVSVPTAPTGSGPNASEPLGPTPTTAATTAEDPRIPYLGDFSGTLTARKTTTSVGNGVGVDLQIRNITDHLVEPGLGSLRNGVAIVCARDLTPDGLTTQPLESNRNLLFVVSPGLAPGESSGRSGTYDPTADDVGTVTCAGVIVTTDNSWQDGSIRSIGRLTNIPAVSFTVTVPDTPATTAGSVPASTTTTVVGP